MIFLILGIPSAIILLVIALEWWKDSRQDKGARVIAFDTCGYCGGISQRWNGETLVNCDQCNGTGRIPFDDSEKFYHEQ